MGANCSCQKDLLGEESTNQFIVNGANPTFANPPNSEGNNPSLGIKTGFVQEENRLGGTHFGENRDSVASYGDNTFGSKTVIEGYQGEMLNGMAHGRGKEINKNGDEYIGQFSKGQKDGYGIYTKHGHYKYTGNFKNNLIHGFGTMEFENKSLYKGEFENGLFHGKGTFIDKNRIEKTGIWRNGEFIS